MVGTMIGFLGVGWKGKDGLSRMDNTPMGTVLQAGLGFSIPHTRILFGAEAIADANRRAAQSEEKAARLQEQLLAFQQQKGLVVREAQKVSRAAAARHKQNVMLARMNEALVEQVATQAEQLAALRLDGKPADKLLLPLLEEPAVVAGKTSNRARKKPASKKRGESRRATTLMASGFFVKQASCVDEDGSATESAPAPGTPPAPAPAYISFVYLILFVFC